MNKIAAVVFTLGALVLIAVGGWGLLYLPAKMEAAAKGAIADFNLVLARSNPPLRLTYGAVSANPITATVTITDAALGRTNGAALRAGEIALAIDPFSGEISAVEARALRFKTVDGLLKVEAISAVGLGEASRDLLSLAARGMLTTDTLIEGLVLTRLHLTGLVATTRGKGEMRLSELAFEGLDKGKIDVVALNGLSAYSRSGRGGGELALENLELKNLNLGEIYRAVKRAQFIPYFKAPLLSALTFNGLEVNTPEARFGIAEMALGATYTHNGQGGLYANKSWFTIKGLVATPDANAPSMARFRKFGLTRLQADIDMVFNGDHERRRMAVEKFSLRFAELADFDLKLAIGNVPSGAYVLSLRPDEMLPLITAFKKATLIGASMRIRNHRLVQIALEQSAKEQGIEVKALIARNIAQARAQAAALGISSFIPLIDQLEKFLITPGVLTITLAPPNPLSITQIEAWSKTEPARLVPALGLKIEASN